MAGPVARGWADVGVGAKAGLRRSGPSGEGEGGLEGELGRAGEKRARPESWAKKEKERKNSFF